MTFMVIHYFMKNLRLNCIKFHGNLYQNRLLIECEERNLLKSQIHKVPYFLLDVEELTLLCRHIIIKNT